MKIREAFLIIGVVIMFFLCIGLYMQKEAERKTRIGMQEMFVSFIERANSMQDAFKKEIDRKEEIIGRLFAQIEKERKIKTMLVAKIREKNLLHRIVTPEIKRVELEKIVITSLPLSEGKVLAVDSQEDVVIVNLGSADNVRIGDRFSVYRGPDFIGDIELIKIQERLSAGAVLSEEKEVKIAVNDSIRRF